MRSWSLADGRRHAPRPWAGRCDFEDVEQSCMTYLLHATCGPAAEVNSQDGSSILNPGLIIPCRVLDDWPSSFTTPNKGHLPFL